MSRIDVMQAAPATLRYEEDRHAGFAVKARSLECLCEALDCMRRLPSRAAAMLSEREPESGLGLIDRLLRRSGLDGEAALPDARKLGRRMAALYRRWQRSGGPDLPRLTEALLHHIGVPADTPLGATCREAALAVSRWEGGAYHSARHHAEVATNAIVLATIDARLGGRLPAHDLGLL